MKVTLGSFVAVLGASTVSAFTHKHIGLQEDDVGTLSARADYNSSTFQQFIDHKVIQFAINTCIEVADWLPEPQTRKILPSVILIE